MDRKERRLINRVAKAALAPSGAGRPFVSAVVVFQRQAAVSARAGRTVVSFPIWQSGSGELGAGTRFSVG